MTTPLPVLVGPDRSPRGWRMRALVRRWVGRFRAGRRRGDHDLGGILDLFEELAYAGEVTRTGQYIHHSSGPTFERFLGGPRPADCDPGSLWETLLHADDREKYDSFNRRLLSGEDAEVTYRLCGLDGVTRILWDRARPRRRSGGSVLVRGIISDVTGREEADARLTEVSARFTRLLDVTGEHVYVALAHPGPRGDAPVSRQAGASRHTVAALT